MNATHKLISVPSFESRPTIAVLPFNNLFNDPEQEYFADGLAEDLINAPITLAIVSRHRAQLEFCL
jgi:TolB-like protein